MPLIDHPRGDYRFLPGIAPYSCGVASVPGFEIVHVTLQIPVPYLTGFLVIEKHLNESGRSKQALCGIELRSPSPFSFEGFAEFNRNYARILEGWGLFVEGANPVARTNVAPALNPPLEPMLYGFSYSRPSDSSLSPTFVVAGAGELPEGILAPEGIICAGDLSPEGLETKARFVMDLMERRLLGLGCQWDQATAIDVYTIHPLDRILPEVILSRSGTSGGHGIRWFYSRPPIVDIEYEMDLRGVRTELRIG
ncbi:2-amino-5-chloromuconate deaminase CnbZ [Tundrisphaera lichenicola]|uniref:2-amino-5-chloromuconate deaminase CnbZ n=1 Tax=Tundrisphaera lichenicola TaxID=2029860 RepID=UPI003EBDED01